ncbi:MAG: nuclear transport factor 2 family protein [Vicinamibacterales bacterium]
MNKPVAIVAPRTGTFASPSNTKSLPPTAETTMTPRRQALTLLLNVLLLAVLLAVFRHPHAQAYGAGDNFVYGRGTASADVRRDLVRQLEAFQDGYLKRDIGALDAFAARLLAPDVVALGTMPREIYVGADAVKTLVRGDWESWGDCTFFSNTAQISSLGDVAWFSLIGYVKFDLSRFLVLPLRVSGVLTRTDGDWRFAQLQFQFDLDLSLLLLADVLLLIWLAVNIVTLVIAVVRGRRARA